MVIYMFILDIGEIFIGKIFKIKRGLFFNRCEGIYTDNFY